MTTSVGKVFLVGAGPGDPGLITRRGADVIELADVIVVDALVNPALLRTHKTKRIIYVGKRGPGAPAGASMRLPQQGINRLLVKLAQQGHRVVRLKGGDPFVFGRGGEEMMALIQARIPFEIIPGVSSAIAAPAYAGIPVSDRRWASQVTLITGQESRDEHELAPGIEWEKLSDRGTLVILMGVSQWPRIQQQLMSQGWSPSKPVVAIESGTWPEQRILKTTLQQSVQQFRSQSLHAPAVIVVGDVARLSSASSWFFKQKPLLGKKVVVTRGVHQNFELSSRLEEYGAEVIVCPAIRVVPLVGDPEVTNVLQQLKSRKPIFHGVVFLSVNAVRTFARLLGGEQHLLRPYPIFAVGPQTAEAIESFGWKVKKMAKEYEAQAILPCLGSVKGKTWLIPRVQNGPKDLIELIEKKGGVVKELGIYRTVSAPPPSREVKKSILKGVDAITFTSASTVKNFMAFFSPFERKKIFHKTKIMSIGPTTTAALKSYRLHSIYQSQKATMVHMVERLIKIL